MKVLLCHNLFEEVLFSSSQNCTKQLKEVSHDVIEIISFPVVLKYCLLGNRLVLVGAYQGASAFLLSSYGRQGLEVASKKAMKAKSAFTVFSPALVAPKQPPSAFLITFFPALILPQVSMRSSM
ncbi:hypothetical protein D4T97_000620 [Siminovitchia acidinfaciens]|uniref:Uncharacterized protein n=1 Tax=Siminovitchia acidinfaciens TaxID=2321395 RepID=A0A429Y6L8_9BACI|nr:hypothetical protein [Siminovitchia acidinfaciens]RST77038.1 hypothetical protein D4T97_000620 [Siminovitchia acidinfaciens]